MNNFQTILIATFLAFFVFGVMVFSGLIKIGKTNSPTGIVGKVVIWGTFPSFEVSDLIENSGGTNSAFTIDYVEKDINTYQSELIEAFATDSGPDLFIIPQDMVLRNYNFIYKIPYQTYSEKEFRSKYVDGSDFLLSNEGVIGFPLLVDPMVLYYNKNILTNAKILYPPLNWNDLFEYGNKLIKRDANNKITGAMIAFGQYDNVNHAKEILSMLFMQSGNKIVAKGETGYKISLDEGSKTSSSTIENVVNFFMEFSNPMNESYTWNRSLPNSYNMFTTDRLAFYLGYASELFKIESINPNLSFDVDSIPQTNGTTTVKTNAKFYNIVLNKKSKNIQSAFNTIALLNSPEIVKELSIKLSLPPASRSLLKDKQESPYLQTFYDSAIVSRTWLDPNKEETDIIFKEMIENSLSNKLSSQSAIKKAINQLELILNK